MSGESSSMPAPAKRGVPYRHQPFDPNDTVDLLGLLFLLWNRKWAIGGVSAVFAVIGAAYALLATPIYRAEAVLMPSRAESAPSIAGGLGGLASLAGIDLGATPDGTRSLATLRSRAFIEDFINDYNLLPILFSEDWDEENQQWISSDQESWPQVLDGVEYFVEGVRSVNEEVGSGLITLAIEWHDPEQAAEWVDILVRRINERVRSEDLADSEARLAYLSKQLEDTNLVELRQALSSLIEEQIQTIMLAQAEEEYAFQVIDPPRVPIEPVAPRRVLIVFLALVFGGIFSACVEVLRYAAANRRSEVQD